MRSFARPSPLAVLAFAAGVCALLLQSGCENGMDRIDRHVTELLNESSGTLGPDAYPASIHNTYDASPNHIGLGSPEANERPSSVNPSASELEFRPMVDSSGVLARLDGYDKITGTPVRLNLQAALRQAFRGSREYIFAEEDFVTAALRLLVERHLWGPRFFDTISTEVVSSGNDGFFTTSLQVVNDFRVTQRLPYGGTVSARALATAVEDLHSRVSDGDSLSAGFLLDANIPLLRGAGLAARETLIQQERDLIYAARDFETFRRDFLFEIVRDFLDLAVQQRAVVNAERQVEQLRQVEQRERALYESGRTDLFNAALAQQATVAALDQLYQRREALRLDIDRFKVRLGIPVEQSVEIDESTLNLPVPDVTLEDAVRSALTYRLDLQNERDQVDDARRNVAIAQNNLLPDVNVTGSVNVPTDNLLNSGRIAVSDSVLRAGVSIGLPIDREIERLQLRQAQVQLQRSQLEFTREQDTATVEVRAAVRAIDRARYTVQIQERNVSIGQDRVESINAAPDRATARDASEASDDLLQALDNRDRALRDLQQAILQYLRLSGQLRVAFDGSFLPLSGMTLTVAPPINQEFFIIPHVIFLKLPLATLRPIPGADQQNAPPPDPEANFDNLGGDDGPG